MAWWIASRQPTGRSCRRVCSRLSRALAATVEDRAKAGETKAAEPVSVDPGALVEEAPGARSSRAKVTAPPGGVASPVGDFLSLLPARLLAQPEAGFGGGGDFSLNPDFRPVPNARYREAAVLIAIVGEGASLAMILTVRHADLSAHPGQIAFPGGKIDRTDSGALACALREAEEEIGLPPSAVETLGFLPAYLTGTGYRVVPLLGRVAGPFVPRPNAGEVASVFEVPVDFLMNPANHFRASRILNGVERHFYEMPYGPHHIWGATAGIIRSLYQRVYA